MTCESTRSYKLVSFDVQICQIILGLKPLDPLEEYECVSAWLTREEKRGLKHGQIWYLISMDWWTSWFNYACPHNSVMSNSDSGMVSMYVITTTEFSILYFL